MRRLFFSIFFTLPVVAVIFFIASAFMYGNTGFKIDKTQKGMLISKISAPVNPVELDDLVISAHGLSYHEILGFCLTMPKMKKPGEITVLRNSKEVTFFLKTIPFTALSLFELIWPKLMLIVVCLTLGSIVLYKASHSPAPTLFFLMTSSMSTVLAATIPSSILFLSPLIFSCTFILHVFFNWIAFGLWIHFALRFPGSRDLIKNRWWIPFFIYVLPGITTFGGALYAAGFTPEFWGWVQRLRNFYLPFIIIGVFIKHAIDYKLTKNQQEKNQIKLPLIAYWLSFAPYLFFYLLPNLLLDAPFISFRSTVFAFFILPMAYFAGIIQYKLFDVDQIISRTIAYVAIIISLSIIYSLFFTGLQKWFFGEHVLSKEIFLGFLILVNVIFHPVILKLDRLIRKFFFRYESIAIKTMHHFSNMISATLHLPDLVRMVTEDLPRAIEVESIAVMTLETKRSRLFPEHLRFGTTPWTKSRLLTLFNDPSVESFYTDLVTDDIKLKEELREIRKNGFSIILPLRGSQSLLAILFIGPQKSGGHFHEKDIHLLASFANQAAIALENAIQHETLIESKQQLEIMFEQKVQSEKMAAIGEMTSILAHELKNPLGIIHSSAQYLSEGKQSKAVAQEMLHYIINEVDHLNLSINSILKLAKQKAPDFSKVDLSAQIYQLVDQWKLSQDHKAIVQIDINIVEPLPFIYADFRQLSQVILNLVRNSEEMIDAQGKVEIIAKQENDFVQIQVIDDGPGIPRENLDKVFQSFFTTKKQGLGLGLAVCKQIINAHNGILFIKNRTQNNKTGIVTCIKLPIKPLATIGKPHLEKIIIPV